MDRKQSFRWRQPRNVQEEAGLLCDVKPKGTMYKTKWAFKIFRNWQSNRVFKFPVLEVGSVFKDYAIHRVKSAEESLTEMDSVSLDYWMTKFVQEVANKSGGSYPPRTFFIHPIVASTLMQMRSNTDANEIQH